MDKNNDLIDEILAGNGENDPEVLEMISENCKVISEEQKNRILGIIREKEHGEEIQDECTSADNEEKDLSVVEYRKTGIIKIFAGLAACVCLAAGIKMLGDRNEQFIPSGDDSVKTTTVTEAKTTDVTTGENAVSGSSETAPVKETAVVTVTGVTENTVSVPETGTAAVNRMQETEQKTARTENITVSEIPAEDKKTAEIPAENTVAVTSSVTEAYREIRTEESAGPEEGVSENEVSEKTETNGETGQPVTATHITRDPVALTVDAGVYEAKAGDTVKLKIRTTDIKEAYHAVVGFLEIDTEKFTLLSVTAGDSDDPDNENSRVYHNSAISEYMSDEKTQTVRPLYCDTENINEGVVIATLELKINNAINDGNYVIPFSISEDCSMVNQIIAKAKNNGFDEARVLNAEYRGALIKVKN
ncbi:MAG: hypothetical protein IJL67_07125 [Oscillospiraceae bacterium]|nr:hypothetical protein [Oscillospiraceae bacterium]